MSLLDAFASLTSQAGRSEDAPTAQQHTGATQALLEHFSEQPGGLGGLLNQFRANGMDSHVASWLSPQANQPVAPQQVEQTLGSDHLSAIAAKAGLSPEIAKVVLAAALPILISHLSHGSGELPQQASQGGGLTGLAESLFSRAL